MSHVCLRIRRGGPDYLAGTISIAWVCPTTPLERLVSFALCCATVLPLIAALQRSITVQAVWPKLDSVLSVSLYLRRIATYCYVLCWLYMYFAGCRLFQTASALVSTLRLNTSCATRVRQSLQRVVAVASILTKLSRRICMRPQGAKRIVRQARLISKWACVAHEQRRDYGPSRGVPARSTPFFPLFSVFNPLCPVFLSIL